MSVPQLINGVLVHERDCDCQSCQDEWATWNESLRRFARNDPKPATDREWREYLDREFPRVHQQSS